MEQERNFRFSRRSGTGTLVLLGILLTLTVCWRLLPALVPAREDTQQQALQTAWETFSKEHTSTEQPATQGYAAKETQEVPAAAVHLAAFDPNTATEAELAGLGLPVRTARTLIKYRSKGGKFRTREDLQKLYTLSKEDYSRIAPYVRIAGRNEAAAPATYNKYSNTTAAAVIDLNTADAEALVALRGIGPAFARRILNFRNALGGFVSVTQLQEVYGFPDSTYQQLKTRFTVNTRKVQQININTATEADLGHHPYIGRKLAAGIIKLRTELKTFGQIEQIQQVSLINDEKYRKIAPYLSTH